MARVSSTAQSVRDLTGGVTDFDIPAQTVRALFSALEARYPGLGELASSRMALAIDGEIHQDALAESLAADAEVVLNSRIVGG